MANPSPSSGPLIPTKSSPPSGEGIKCWIQSTSVNDLCNEIRQFTGLEDEVGAQLTDLAEFCYDHPSFKQQLVTHLINRLTHCNPSNSHYLVMRLPWRAIFTTNFDDVAERSLKEFNPLIVTPGFDVMNLSADRRPLYYLHGRALDFIEAVTDPRLVLSETNYLEIKEKNRNLYSALINEVHAASRIFFIGYPIHDAEIATRLFAIDGLREKSIVICGPSEKAVTLNRLKKFGEIFPIGVDNLAARLPAPSTIPTKKRDLHLLRFVDFVEPTPANTEIDSGNVVHLLLSGEFDYGAFACQQRQRHQRPEYCVPRTRHLAEVFEAKINRFIVTSDLGNGKSVFLNQLAFEAHARGYEVFSIKTQMPETLAELDEILPSSTKRLYIIDSFVRFRKAVRHIGRRLPLTSILVCAANQSVNDPDYANIADEMGGAPREIDLNILDSNELSNWDDLLERWGFWEDRIEESTADRVEFLRTRCGAENRSIILALFRETRLSKKIHEIVEYFLHQNPQHSKAFIAVLINALCKNHVEWPRIEEWIGINNSTFKASVLSSKVCDFMSGSRRWYEFTSAELASYILNNYDFDIENIVDVYTKIVRETAYSANDPRGGFDARENLKELMRFRFLTRLFSHPTTGANAINAVYQRLSNVPRIRTNDQFWLQYAMSRMELDDLKSAETYLNTAIGLAEKKGASYSKFQIIDQQIRLILRKNSRPKNVINNKELLSACENIERLLNDKSMPAVHPLRSAEHLLDLLELKADQLDQKLIITFKSTVDLMRQKLPDGRLEKSQKGETEVIRKKLRSCALVLGSL
jgi:hypothetical protein